MDIKKSNWFTENRINNLIDFWELAKKLTDYWELGTSIQALLNVDGNVQRSWCVCDQAIPVEMGASSVLVLTGYHELLECS